MEGKGASPNGGESRGLVPREVAYPAGGLSGKHSAMPEERKRCPPMVSGYGRMEGGHSMGMGEELWDWEHILEPVSYYIGDLERHELKALEPREDFFKKHESQFL